MNRYFRGNLLITSLILFGFSFLSSNSLFAQPSNDDLCNAIPLILGASCSGTPNGDNSMATIETGEPIASCYLGGVNSVWFSFVAPPSGAVTVSTDFGIGTNNDTEIALYDLPGGNCNMPSSLVELGCSQDISFTNFLSFIPTTAVTPGQTYYVSVSGWNGTQGTFCIEINDAVAPINDSLCNAIPLIVGASCNGLTNGDNTNATSQTGEPTGSCFVGGANSVWYTFIGPPSGFVTISTDNGIGTNTDTEIALFELPNGDCFNPSDLVEIDCDQDVGGGVFNSTITATTVNPGQLYFIQVSGWNGSEGSFCVTVDAVIPPANDMICSATALTVGGSCAGTPNGDNSAALFQSGEPMASCSSGMNTVWYSFVGPASGFVNITTDTTGVNGTNAGTSIGLYALPGGNCMTLSDLFELECGANNGLTGASIDSAAVLPGETYYVQIVGGSGSFCVEVESAMPSFNLPLNDSLCNAFPLIVGGTCNPLFPNGNNTNATTQVSEPTGSCFVGGSNSVWYTFIGPPSGYVDITTNLPVDSSFSANTDTEIAVYTLPNGDCFDLTDLTEVACNQDISGANFLSQLNILPVSPGVLYFIQVSGWNGSEGAFCIEVSSANPLPNDNACDAELLPVDGTTITSGTNVGATLEMNEAFIQPPGNDGTGYDGWDDPSIDGSVWYKFAAPASGSVFIDLCNNGLGGGTDFDTQVALYSSSDCNDFTQFSLEGANDDLLNCQALFASYLEVYCLTPGDTFLILVDGWGGETGNFGIRVGEINDPLSLGSAMLDPSCVSNNDGIINVTGNGGGSDYEFIWNDGDTSALRTDLSIGIYTVSMTDGCDSTITESFILAGNPDLEANAGNDTTICEGETVDLGSGMTGANGLPILGEQAIGVDLSAQSVVEFKLATPNTQSAGGMGTGATLIAGDYAAGTFYALDQDNDQLLSYNSTTGTFQTIGASTPMINHSWSGMAYDQTSSTMYAMSLTQDPNNGVFSSQLYTIDLTSGMAASIALINLDAVSALAIDNTGNMYGVDVIDNLLISIDKMTGNATAIGSTGYLADLFQDADFDPETNKMYIASSTLGAPNGTAPILRIADLVTGATLPLGDISGTTVAAFAINENQLEPYMYSWSPSIGLSDSTTANPTFSSSTGGTYVVSVRDECQVMATDTIVISVSTGPTASPTSTPDNGTGNGTASANASGGVPPYSYAWSNGATTEKATDLDTGVYVVTITDSFGCSVTDSVEVGSNVSIDDLLNAGINSIDLFPNPTNGVIQVAIELFRPQTIDLAIFDMKGQKMMTIPSFNGTRYESTISLAKLSAGIYMLKVSTDQGQAYKRIVLSK